MLYGYHRPIGLLKKSIAEGGPIEQLRTELGRREMIRVAHCLPSVGAIDSSVEARAHFLSGQKYWHQTVFCFLSMQMHSEFKITPVIYDDGTLNKRVQDAVTRIIPWAVFVSKEEIEHVLDQKLPLARFPTLRRHRLTYPHLRKLTDIHAGSECFRLVLDSDMIVYRKPNEILKWFSAREHFYMQDVDVFYGYPIEKLNRLASQPLPQPVNVGLYALDGRNIDWEKVEYWCRSLLNECGPSYLLEQALTAMILAGTHATALPRDKYIVMPDLSEGRAPTGILHHYVGPTKRSYYQHGWRTIASSLMGAAAARCDLERERA